MLAASRPALNREALEARVALRIAGALSQRSDALPHDIAERLRVAREQAVDRARELRKLSAAPAHQAQGGGTLALSGPPSWWLRLASLAPLALLVLGLLFIQRSYVDQQIRAAAEIDAAILTDDLPPASLQRPGIRRVPEVAALGGVIPPVRRRLPCAAAASRWLRLLLASGAIAFAAVAAAQPKPLPVQRTADAPVRPGPR